MSPEDYNNTRHALKKKHSRVHGSRELRNDAVHPFAMSPFDGIHNSFDPFHSSLLHSVTDSFSPFGGAMLDPFSSRSFGFDMMGHGNPFMDSTGSGCQFSSVMVTNTVIGEDGKSHVEKYARSVASDGIHNIHEQKEAYTNSKSGIDKYAHEKKLGDKGRRLVKERYRHTDEIKVNDEVYGMDRTEDNVRQLEEEWSQQRARYLGKGALLPGVDTPLTLGATHSSFHNPSHYDPSCDNPRLLPN